MAEIGNVTVRVDAVITDEQYREAMSAVRAANERMDLLEAENAKLRELVKDVMPIVCRGCYERLCEMPEGEHPFVTCSFADRMGELGVEV